jgi:hypothetical protein
VSEWADPEQWARLRSGEACVICRQGAPNDILVALETAWVTVIEDAPMRGYGNTIPHLHMHFYPRYPGDPFEDGPIDPKMIGKPVYAPGEIAVMRTRLREALLG